MIPLHSNILFIKASTISSVFLIRLITGCIGLALLSAITINTSFAADANVKMAANGMTLPKDYKNWKLISISHRTDNQTMRSILGNDIAIKAARSGQTNPWPKGTILAKIVWKQKAKETWPTAIVPNRFIHAEFMYKDDEKYKASGGWNYARWLGLEQKPYGKDKNFTQECIACHTPVKDNDWVFTTPAILP